MKKIIIMLFSVILMLFLYSTVNAQDNEDCIVILSEENNDINLFEDYNMEVLSEKNRIYKTDKITAKNMLDKGIVKSVEEDTPIELFEYNNFNDEYFNEQWQYKTINISKAKEISNNGKGVKVAVIDSGIYRDHPDINKDNIEQGYNFVKDNTDTMDLDNHGTAVAGLICAKENNSIGIAGIASDAKIVPLVIYSEKKGNISHIIKAIDAAVNEYDCKVLNISAGAALKEPNKALQEIVDYAVKEKHAIIVSAVGNDGKDILNYPAACENVIGVGSVGKNLNVSRFSQRNNSVDVTAPGESLVLLANNEDNIYNANYKKGYMTKNGTSFSSPIVSGLVALVASKYPDITYNQMMDGFKATVFDMEELGYDINYGYGIVDMYEMFSFLNSSKVFYISPVAKINDIDYNIKAFASESKPSKVIITIKENDVLKYYDIQNMNDNLFNYRFKYDLKENESINIMIFENFDNLSPLANVRNYSVI